MMPRLGSVRHFARHDDDTLDQIENVMLELENVSDVRHPKYFRTHKFFSFLSKDVSLNLQVGAVRQLLFIDVLRISPPVIVANSACYRCEELHVW